MRKKFEAEIQNFGTSVCEGLAVYMLIRIKKQNSLISKLCEDLDPKS